MDSFSHRTASILGRALLVATSLSVAAAASAATEPAASPLGYKLVCGQAWKSTPVGGAVPDRPKYTIERTRCVGVQNRPAYLDKPRNEVRIQPARELPKPGNLNGLTPANPVKIRPKFKIRRR